MCEKIIFLKIIENKKKLLMALKMQKLMPGLEDAKNFEALLLEYFSCFCFRIKFQNEIGSAAKHAFQQTEAF